jgi:hypothetical protein
VSSEGGDPLKNIKKVKAEAEILKYYFIIQSTAHGEIQRERKLERITDRPWAALGFSESDTAASHTLGTSRYAKILFSPANQT